MYLTRSEYDRGVNTFSPEGRLFQVEYALEAIKLGTTAVGIRARDGVVLAVEKRISSPLLEPSSVEKLFQIDTHIGCAVSGLTPDALSMIEYARVQATAHRFQYDEPMPTESLTQAVCDLALRFGEGAHGEKRLMSRPFGVALLVAGFDADADADADADDEAVADANANVNVNADAGAGAGAGAGTNTTARCGAMKLYYADPSGSYVAWDAKAIGAGSEGAQDELQTEYSAEMTAVDAEALAVRILSKIMEEKITNENVGLVTVTRERGYRMHTPLEVAQLLEKVGVLLPANQPQGSQPASAAAATASA